MEFAQYLSLVKAIPFGKKLPDALYIHRYGIEFLPVELRDFLQKALSDLQLAEVPYDLVKLHIKAFKVSLLAYPTFWEAPYPELKTSITIDLITRRTKVSSYENSDNPPILHRKETFLPTGHPKIKEFSEITREAEEAGLFESLNTIGFKQNWLRQIKKKGLQLIKGHLEKISNDKPADDSKEATENRSDNNDIPLPEQILRHRTAINRNTLSSPMQSLYNHDYLNEKHSVFDYGCGHGDDIRELQAHGIDAKGWDPVFRPDADKQPADIVNLGFIINVIEKPSERVETLREAFSLTKKVLAVSAMLGGEATVAKFRSFGDGVVTSRGTFQKYYTQQELREFIEGALDKNAVAVGPGVFFVFPDQDEEQLFLANRQRRKFDWVTLSQREARIRPRIERASKFEMHKAVIEDYKNACLSLGRQCKPDEFDFTAQIRKVFGSLPKAWEHIAGADPELFEQAKRARIEDLLVYFGLTLFGKRKAYAHMPKSLQRDVQEFFGNHKAAIEQARSLLFSVGSTQNIHAACILANNNGIGYLDGDHSLQLHTSLISSLPAILRLYVGCATQLYGDVEKADIVKIHIQSGKVSLMRYDDFINKPLPQLLERIKIKMREQQIDFFDYTTQPKIQFLYIKSRFIQEDFPFYKEQKAFDEKLQTMTQFNFSGFGPPAEKVLEGLEQIKLNCNQFLSSD